MLSPLAKKDKYIIVHQKPQEQPGATIIFEQTKILPINADFTRTLIRTLNSYRNAYHT